MSVLASHFEEIETGDRFVTRGRTVTEADVVGFANLTGDTHPQHTDAEWAASGRFGERIAHGMLILSFAAGLVPFDPDRVVALRRVGDATFKAPVKLGDTIHVEGSVEDKRELDDEHGLVTCRWRVLNQRGKLVARVSVDAVWKREPVAEEPDRSKEPVLI
jgi:3-hydroxybutyryl-CoA dehydratase